MSKSTPEPTDPAGVSEMAEIKATLVAVFSDAKWREANPILARRVNQAAHRIEALRTPDPVLEVVRTALEQIASCETHHPGDVVSIARAALQTINERGKSA